MTTVIFQRCDGKPAGDPIDLPRARRRLSAIVKRHADRTRPHIVCVYRAGDPWAPTDFSVRLRKTWGHTRIGPNDTVAIIYAPRGGGGGAGGGSRAGKAAGIGLLVASIALMALGQFWAIGALSPLVGGTGIAGTIWSGATASLPAGPNFLLSRNGKSNMTAVNAFARDCAISIITDGQAYTRDGDLLGLTNKVEILAHLPAVIAARGQTIVRNALAYQAAEAFETFDELLDGIAAMLRTIRKALGVPDDVPVLELTVAGYSAVRGALELWTISDADRPGLPAFELREVAASIAPLDSALMEAIEAAGLDIEDGDPESLGLEIVRMQRDREWQVPHNGRQVRSVGGYAQCTTVGRAGISTRIVERWAA